MTAAPTPFASAEEAWFWTIRALGRRRDGLPRERSEVFRPCDPNDVIGAIDTLYRRGTITRQHADVLRRFGTIGEAPPAGTPDMILWDEVMAAAARLLRAKGIVE